MGEHTGDGTARLRVFRARLYSCMKRRADALFELTDAVLTAGNFPSPPHLSLTAVHRRGWGSLYAALAHGRTCGQLFNIQLGRPLRRLADLLV